jgi:hypothetical protein
VFRTHATWSCDFFWHGAKMEVNIGNTSLSRSRRPSSPSRRTLYIQTRTLRPDPKPVSFLFPGDPGSVSRSCDSVFNTNKSANSLLQLTAFSSGQASPLTASPSSTGAFTPSDAPPAASSTPGPMTSLPPTAPPCDATPRVARVELLLGRSVPRQQTG